MKIEISEVFVTRTDSTALEYEPSAVGIAGLVTRSLSIKQRNHTRRVSLYVRLSRFVPLCAAIMGRILKAGISPCTAFSHLLSASITKQRILFIKLQRAKSRQSARGSRKIKLLGRRTTRAQWSNQTSLNLFKLL